MAGRLLMVERTCRSGVNKDINCIVTVTRLCQLAVSCAKDQRNGITHATTRLFDSGRWGRDGLAVVPRFRAASDEAALDRIYGCSDAFCLGSVDVGICQAS
jgi:hypothetical protein